MPEHFTPTEAAEYLRISRRTLDKFLHTTEPEDYIPSARVGTKRIIRRADLDAWVERHMEDAS